MPKISDYQIQPIAYFQASRTQPITMGMGPPVAVAAGGGGARQALLHLAVALLRDLLEQPEQALAPVGVLALRGWRQRWGSGAAILPPPAKNREEILEGLEQKASPNTS